MIELSLSIICSCLIFIFFKSFPKLKVDTFQAVLSNYIVAFICGFFLFRNQSSIFEANSDILLHGFLCGLLFISLFIIMGLSSQINGVGTTSIAVKMSMALSVLFVLISTLTPISLLGIMGLGLAFIGVFLVSTSKEDSNAKPVRWMLIVLFIGSALLDYLLFAIQKNVLGTFHPGSFSAIGFAFAGIMGSFYFLTSIFFKKIKFDFKSWIYGVFLGIPNFFSIYLLIASYKSTGWEPSKVISISNIAIVAISSFIGLILFKESFTRQKFLGIFLCISAMILCFIYL